MDLQEPNTKYYCIILVAHMLFVSRIVRMPEQFVSRPFLSSVGNRYRTHNKAC